MTVRLDLQREKIDRGEGPDSINCLCEEVRRSGRVRVMKMNHSPLENEILACNFEWNCKKGEEGESRRQHRATAIIPR